VRAYIYKRDQYERVVGTVYVRRWGVLKRDVGFEMLKAGMATVYEAKSGAEFGTLEEQYREAEKKAKAKKIGLWSQTDGYESPRDYKTRMSNMESGGGQGEKADVPATTKVLHTLGSKLRRLFGG
jgi:endonuclease YncB( thermonuclease family)